MNLNEAKEILKNNGYLVESTKTEIDCSNWHWIKSMSSYNNNYYYDTMSNDEFYLEEYDEDYGDYLYYACDKSGKKIKYLGYTNREGSVENCNGKLVLDTSMPKMEENIKMNLKEAKEILENHGYLLENANYSVNMDKLNKKIKEMQMDASILEQVGTMIIAFFDRECGATCKTDIDQYHVDHSCCLTIKTQVKDVDISFKINITDYNEKLLWIEYDIDGKEGGIEAKYSNDKYYSLLNDENSYLGKIMDLISSVD